jgi:predicted Zn-dependent protease
MPFTVLQKRQDKIMKNILLFTLIASLLTGCLLNLVTGRKQLSLVNESELQLMATSQYNAFLEESKVLNSGKEANMVDRVGGKIANAITMFYTNKGDAAVLDGYTWEFNTVESKDVNAWCMPGGKVVVYTGILPVTQTENGLAIVMGHEIAHAVAKHGNERMSQAMVQQLGGMALQVAIVNEPQKTQDLFMTSFGIGSQLGAILPWSRQQETEADKYGLIFAAMAGYDPREAIPFWQRMAAASGGSPPEFLSTHPADETRIKNLNKFMPEALKYYNKKK